jgi:predicted dehydrogenase
VEENMKGKVGIAVIGCGRIGITHIEAIKELPEISYLAAVVDANTTLAEKTAAKYNTKYYGTPEDAFKDSSVEAVVVCLPNNYHAPVTISAAENGKHVLVEKPFAISFNEAERMVNAARKQDIVMMCAQSLRFVPELQKAQKSIKSEIGEPFNMCYTFALFFDSKKAPAWWKYKEMTGGPVLQFLGPHIIDATLWFFEGKDPESVYAHGGSFNPDFEGLDEATILIKFRDGAMATNYLSINTRPAVQECLIAGSKGRIYFKHLKDASEGQVGNLAVEISIGERLIVGDPKKCNNIRLEEENFVKTILKRDKPFVKIEDTLLQMKIIEAAQQSIETKKVVEIN